jgi:hypothetical protein
MWEQMLCPNMTTDLCFSVTKYFIENNDKTWVEKLSVINNLIPRFQYSSIEYLKFEYLKVQKSIILEVFKNENGIKGLPDAWVEEVYIKALSINIPTEEVYEL